MLHLKKIASVHHRRGEPFFMIIKRIEVIFHIANQMFMNPSPLGLLNTHSLKWQKDNVILPNTN